MWKGQRSGQSLLWSSAPEVWGPGSSGADWGGCRCWRARRTDRPERAMGKLVAAAAAVAVAAGQVRSAGPQARAG